MRIPVWLTLGVGIAALLYGVYRIRLSFRRPVEPVEGEPARPRRGLAAMSAGMHRFVGIVYALLGAALLAASFGWSPLAGLFEGKPAPQKTMELEQRPKPADPVQPK